MNDTDSSLEGIVPDLRKILVDVDRMVDRCDRRLLTPLELMDTMKVMLDRITDVVPKDSDVYRVFDRKWAGRSGGTSKTLHGYVNAKDCVQLHQLAAVIQSMIEMLSPEFLSGDTKDEYYFTAGDEFAPKLRVWEIIRMARHSVLIVDDYLDDRVFNFIESLPHEIDVKLITGRKKPIFADLLDSLKKRQSNVDARTNDKFHDRFIVIDGSDVWHLGASINGLGVKATRISKVVEEAERKRIITDCQGWWDSGASP